MDLAPGMASPKNDVQGICPAILAKRYAEVLASTKGRIAAESRMARDQLFEQTVTIDDAKPKSPAEWQCLLMERASTFAAICPIVY